MTRFPRSVGAARANAHLSRFLAKDRCRGLIRAGVLRSLPEFRGLFLQAPSGLASDRSRLAIDRPLPTKVSDSMGDLPRQGSCAQMRRSVKRL
jgi:hypothetical protein